MNIFIAVIEENRALLTSEESWHCVKVLRKKAGEKIGVIDGKGGFFEAELIQVHEKQCMARITDGPLLKAKRNYFLHMAVAPTKQMDRMEWMVEKAVEIGVDELSFVVCKNSERNVVKTDRVRKIVESAVKQSLQAYIPQVNEVVDFKQLVRYANYEQKLIAHCFDGAKASLSEVTFTNKRSMVLIGPEGDFTAEEVGLAEASGFKGISLGHNRLRTETAGLYACQAAAILSI